MFHAAIPSGYHVIALLNYIRIVAMKIMARSERATFTHEIAHRCWSIAGRGWYSEQLHTLQIGQDVAQVVRVPGSTEPLGFGPTDGPLIVSKEIEGQAAQQGKVVGLRSAPARLTGDGQKRRMESADSVWHRSREEEISMWDAILNASVAFTTAHFGVVIAAGTTLGFWLLTLSISRPIRVKSDDEIRSAASGYTDAQRARMWDQLRNENDTFNERLNFFLVFESVLLATLGTIYSRPNTATAILQFLAVFGLVITALWFFIQARHKQGVDVLKIRTAATFPEFSLATLPRRRAPFSVSWLLAYGLPLLVAVVWLFMLALVGL